MNESQLPRTDRPQGVDRVMVMPSNNTDWIVDYWQGRYGNLGHLYSPQRKENPRPHIPYALDNGAFSCWKNGQPFDSELFREHVARYAFLALRPMWIVVPDVVTDAEATIRQWREWAPILKELAPGIDLALAVQDGMQPSHLDQIWPKPNLIFVGGTTEYKWTTVHRWCANRQRVHVGRVNTGAQLAICQAAGAESTDGTGWFRGKHQQIYQLGDFLMRQAGKDEPEHLRHIVHYSRLKHRAQLALPLEGMKCSA